MRLLLNTNIYVFMVSIIALAMSHRMTPVSSDTKFLFYCKQGLQLIKNF